MHRVVAVTVQPVQSMLRAVCGRLSTTRRALLVVPAFLVAALLTMAYGLLPRAGVAGLLTACAGLTAAVMVHSVLSGRSAGPRLRALTLAAGLGLTALAGAGSAGAILLAPHALTGDGVPLPAEIPLVSLFLVALLYLPAILRPPQRRDLLTRLRVALDVLGVTAVLMYPAWLLMFSGGVRRGASITALVFGGGAVATAAVAGLHAIRHRAALQWCGPAVALSLAGQVALVVGLDVPGVANASTAALVGAGAINVAGGLLWYGSVRISPETGSVPPPGSEPAAGFPLLTILILGSALVTVYHLIGGGRLDTVSIVLAAVAVSTVVIREWVSAIALRRQSDHLTDQGNRLRGLMFGSTDVAMVLDSNLAVRWQSPAVARQYGLSDLEVLGRSMVALVHADQVDAVHRYLTARMSGEDVAVEQAVEVRLRDGFGRWRDTQWSTGGPDPAGPGRSLVVHIRDVTNVRDLEQALRQATHLDPQTGLVNTDGLRKVAELTVDAGAMIILELGGLTAVGDVHGPELAEVVLVEAARRLRGRVTGADVPARLGEARFAVLTQCGAVRAHLLAGQLVNALSAPYTVAGTVSHLSTWAGLADLTGDEETDEVIRRATLALRSVRPGPPGAVEWYDAEMESRLLRRSVLEQDLPGAVTRGQLDLSFQPIVELPGNHPVGVEAITSWRHPTLGVVPAGELLPLAEELGVLPQIDDWLLKRSCRLLADWRRLHESLWLTVNVRPRALIGPAFQAGLQTALETNDLPYAALVVEVDEQHLVGVRDDVHQPAVDEVAAQLGRLRAQGVRTAVGHFGTGPTSLSRLRILPVDLLKIDREAFGQPSETTSPQPAAVMDVAVILGRRLGMEVIAQGVEDRTDLDTVQTAGCRLGQGNLLGRPMPAEHLEALLEQHRDARRRAHGPI
jgi:PAS domain S-box-containing protein